MQIRGLLRQTHDTSLLELEWGEILIDFINDAALPEEPLDITMTIADVLQVLRQTDKDIKMSILNTRIDLDLLIIDDSNVVKAKPPKQTNFGRKFIMFSTLFTLSALSLITSNISIATGDIDYGLISQITEWLGDILGLSIK